MNPLARYGIIESDVGPTDIPEYVHYPDIDELGEDALSIVDYFTKRHLREPRALVFLKNGVYTAPNGRVSLYSDDHDAIPFDLKQRISSTTL